MTNDDQQFGEEYVKIALAINEHLPGYVDSYTGPDEWMQEAKRAGKMPIADLAKKADQLAGEISRVDGMDPQRKDYLARQVTAMQMSLRLLSGEEVSLQEEVSALFDVQPRWKDETNFEEYHRELDQLLPPGDSLSERNHDWKKSNEISIEKLHELLPVITDKLRDLVRQKFNLPEQESFTVEFVSNRPWSANNCYLGGYRSLIQVNTDLPARIDFLTELMAHEGYPGHHTELAIKEQKLIQQKKYVEHVVGLLNTPSCVVAEGIATAALETLLTGEELEDWFRDELLPRAGTTAVDARTITARRKARDKIYGLDGNAAFMLHDQKAGRDEIRAYLQKYGLYSEKEADQTINFISNPLYRSYIFTYHVGYDLLKELFSKKDRHTYFTRLLEEPVTPSQIRQWIGNQSDLN